jgi:hypothetical protein
MIEQSSQENSLAIESLLRQAEDLFTDFIELPRKKAMDLLRVPELDGTVVYVR